MTEDSAPAKKSYAYYYTDWHWPENVSDLMKSMLLFFDGIALAAPPSMAERLIESDPILAGPLSERELLVNFDPDTEIDIPAAENLANTLSALIRRMPFNWAVGSPEDHCHRVMHHWGGTIARSAGNKLERILIKKGLATPELQEGLWRVHPRVNLLIMLLFAQTLQKALTEKHVSIYPVTCSPELAQGFLGAALGAAHESRGHRWCGTEACGHTSGDGMAEVFWQVDPENNLRISRQYFRRREGQRASKLYRNEYFREPIAIAEDLRNVSVDLSMVPLDEILDFRKKHGYLYEAYARGLREYLSMSDRLDFGRIAIQRREALASEAANLRRLSRAAFGLRSGALMLSLAGAAWTVSKGDSIGALLAALAAAAQAIPPPGERVTAYSYLLQLKDLSG